MTDIAAHAQAGLAPHVGFIRLAPATRSVAPAPLFLLGHSPAALQEELFAQTACGAVGCYTLADAAVAPTGIAMKDGVAFSSLAFIHPPHHVATVTRRLAPLDLPVRHVGGKLAIIYGPSHETYGHWLVDFLPRLWVLAQTGHDILTLRYAVPPDLRPFAARLLAAIGIRPSQLVPYRYWQETLAADLLLMPTGLRTHNRLSPLLAPATAFWSRRLHDVARAVPSHATRLFVSRAHAAPGRSLTNRAEIEAIAAARGYAIIHPQSLGLAEQVAVFAGARIVAGEYGSALHNTVFSRPGTVTVALRGTRAHPSFIQSGVAGALAQHVGYVLGETSGDVEQSFCVPPASFAMALDLAELRAGLRD